MAMDKLVGWSFDESGAGHYCPTDLLACGVPPWAPMLMRAPLNAGSAE